MLVGFRRDMHLDYVLPSRWYVFSENSRGVNTRYVDV
jgi:hypothetical protein